MRAISHTSRPHGRSEAVVEHIIQTRAVHDYVPSFSPILLIGQDAGFIEAEDTGPPGIAPNIRADGLVEIDNAYAVDRLVLLELIEAAVDIL